MTNIAKFPIKIALIMILSSIALSCQPQYENTELIIREGSVLKDWKWYPYQLLRLQGRNTASYAIYFPGEKDETVLITRPYLAINWTGEDVDRFNFDAVSVDDVLENSMIYVVNGFPVLNVFARFYAGGDIQNDIDDITAGLDYLSDKTDKIGIYGGSWGGFEAIYGAVNAATKPVVGVAYYPPTDMESWYNWTISTGESFFSPYRARIDDGANNNFSKWNHQFIVENLETDFLIVHAPQDTLVPYDQSSGLAALTERITLFTQQRTESPLSHGEIIGGYSIPADLTLTTAYLMYKLTDGDILTVGDSRALSALYDDFAVELLRENRIQIYDSYTEQILSNEEKNELLR